MARLRRVAIPSLPYHVTQRGNRKAPVFLTDADRDLYMDLLRQHCIGYAVRVWAYCLMGNHVHLVVVPDRENALSLMLQRVQGDYATHFNTRHQASGHLWQGRFKSSVLDEPHLWNAIRYVERNPVRAGIVVRAETYPWSSAAAHCGLRRDELLSEDLPLLGLIANWSQWLEYEEKAEELTLIRRSTETGRPCAGNEFIRLLESKTGRTLHARAPGRKKKE